LTRKGAVGYNCNPLAGWSSLAARRAHNPKVAGSNPAPATKFKGLQRCRPFLFMLGQPMGSTSIEGRPEDGFRPCPVCANARLTIATFDNATFARGKARTRGSG
jgi:hypothetical protein